MNDLKCSYKSKKYDGKTSCQLLKQPFGKCCHSLKKGTENVKRLIIPSETSALVSFYSRPQLENTLPCSELLGERACLRLSRPHSVAVVQLSSFLSARVTHCHRCLYRLEGLLLGIVPAA